jgi:recombination protein RecT
MNEPQTKQITVIDEVRANIQKMSGQFAMALPSHISPEKFQRVAITAIQNSPDLLNADRRSLYAACMKLAQDGVIPDGREAALVTFSTKQKDGTWIKAVQPMIMVAGILKKIRQSGELATLHAAVVYKNDQFRYWVDTEGQHITHEPILFGERGAAIGVYAMAKTKDGSVFVQPLSLADVEKIRAASRSKDSGPWTSWWEEMAKKSAIRRLAKYLPQSTDVEQALKADEDLFMPDLPAKDHAENQALLELAQEEDKPKRKSRLDKVKEAATPVVEAEEAMPPIPDNMRRGRDEQPPMPEPGLFEPEDVI